MWLAAADWLALTHLSDSCISLGYAVSRIRHGGNEESLLHEMFQLYEKAMSKLKHKDDWNDVPP